MAHFAKIDENNIVTRVLVTRNDMPNEGHDWLVATFGGTWLKTSYNTEGGVHYDPATGEPSDDQTKAFRMNFASAGFTYDADRDAFIAPQPFDSWALNEETCRWEAPVPYPTDGAIYSWDEDTTSWVEIVAE